MARGISKAINSSTIYALNASLPFNMDENGMPIANMIFTMNGKPNMNVAQREAIKRAKDANGKPTKNVAIINIETITTKSSVSASDFIANSNVCKENEVYGHEYITREFQITVIDIFWIDQNGMHTDQIFYDGKTTENKLLNYARDYTKCNNTTITNSQVKNERRYMTNEMYASLAIVDDSNDNDDTDDNEE